MDFKNIILEKKDGIATITLNRPDALNALDVATLLEIQRVLDDIRNDDTIGVVVLTGVGRAFSTGVDLKSIGGLKIEGGNVGGEINAAARGVIQTMEELPKPIIAMVNGFCLTGALEIAMGCDMIIASENSRFGDTHVRWGFRPTWGLSQKLPRAVGIMKAKELSFTAEMISAPEAERIGLITKVVTADELEPTVRALAESMLRNSRDAIAAYKALMNRGFREDLATGLKIEAETSFAINDTEERLKGFRK
jgi:enoyl-CoA hydratase/carnithine racemase